MLLDERNGEIKRRVAHIEHLEHRIARLTADLDAVAHERDWFALNRSASTSVNQPRDQFGQFTGSDDGGGGGNEGQEPKTPPSGGKGALSTSPDATLRVDAGSVLTQWAKSAAFGRTVRKSIAAGKPSPDGVALLQILGEGERMSYPLYREIDPSLAALFSERSNIDLNCTSFSRNLTADAALTLRILQGCDAAADRSPYSPRDDGEHVVAGRFQVLDVTGAEIVLRQVARIAPGIPWPERSAALEEFDVRDALFRAELDGLGSLAMDRA